MKRWARALYQPGIPLGQDGKRVTGSKEHIALSKEAAKEGMVLVKNENKVLPLAKGTRVALFGKGTFDYVRRWWWEAVMLPVSIYGRCMMD